MSPASGSAVARVAAFPKVRVLCLGDIVLDRFVCGNVSPSTVEDPVLALKHQAESAALGGVGRVGRNIAALGGQATIVSWIGDDAEAGEIERLIAEQPRLEGRLTRLQARRTTVHTRFTACGQQLLRIDQEDGSRPGPDAESGLLAAFRSALSVADVVVFADRPGGCLTGAVLGEAIRMTRDAGKPSVADPRHTFRRFAGVTLIQPTVRELQRETGVPCADDAATVAAARTVMDRVDVDAVLVTRPEQGLTLVPRRGEATHFHPRTAEALAATVEGDAALALLALGLGCGASLTEAASLAQTARGVEDSEIEGKCSWDSPHAPGAREHATAAGKLGSLSRVADLVAGWRRQGARIGFTNGCFDVIHPGHVSLLEQAAGACDRLVVALNSDASVRRLKGAGRPIHGETARATVLASIGVVDAVVQFDEDTPLRVIEALRPDVLIKGADYREEQVVGATLVKGYGGEVVLARLLPDAGTTLTIDAIRSRG